MNKDDLIKSVQLAIGADRYENESWYQFFDRLNKEGRLDLRACIFATAVILDYFEAEPWAKSFLPIDTRLEALKKENEPKPKKKK